MLSHSLRAGRVPEMARWIRTGTHRLGHWDALLPSTTPASQAGILHGNNDGIPNFRWLEKETGRLLVANHPEDATVIESRISNGEGLLSPGGASISNIFTGDGERAFLVMSTIKVKERGLGESDAFAWFFVSPYNYINMIVRYLAEVIKENIQSRRQARAGIEPRMHRGFPYPCGPCRHQRRAARARHVAGHPGDAPRHAGHLHGLHRLRRDRPPQRARSVRSRSTRSTASTASCETLLKAAGDAPRPYRFVILADHGQSLGATFLQRYGVTLQDVVRSLMGGSASVAAATAQIEDWGQLNTFLGEVVQTKGVTGSLARAVTRNSSEDGHVEMGPAEAQYTPAGAPRPRRRQGHRGPDVGDRSDGRHGAEPADLVVVAGGNLALIYFNASKERMTLEEIDEHYPDLVAGAREPSRHRRAHRPLGGPRPHLRGQGRHPLPRRGPRGGRGPAGGLRRARRRGRQASRRHRARRRHRGHQPLRPRDPARSPPSRSSSARTAAWAAPRRGRSCSTRPTGSSTSAPLMGAPMVYQQLRRWMERELGMTFGPKGAATTAKSSVASPAAAAASTPGVPAQPAS